jgi:uncharacterized protein with GYD domain
MGTYVFMATWTAQGVANIDGSPSRVDGARKLAKSLGGKMGDFYMTMGAYDMLAVVTMPDDAAMAKFALKLAAGGNVRTTTMKAFTEKEYRGIVGSLGAKR